MKKHRILLRLAVLPFTAGIKSIMISAGTPRCAFIPNIDDQTVPICRVGAATGQLRPSGYAVAGSGPRSATIAQSKFLYVGVWSFYLLQAGERELHPFPGAAATFISSTLEVCLSSSFADAGASVKPTNLSLRHRGR